MREVNLMEKQINVCIYCRVTDKRNIDLLHYQADLLDAYASKHNYAVLGLLKRIDDGHNIRSSALQTLIDSIIFESIDAVLVYSKDRLLCNADALTEFELLCHMHNVSIITYKNEVYI